MSDWSNLDIVTQRLSGDLGIRLVGVNRHYQATGSPLHKQPYIKTRSKLNTGKFHRIVLAQQLAGTSAGDPKQPVNAVWVSRFSLDGKYMAAAGQDCIVRVWKVLIPLEQSPSIKVFENDPVRAFEGHTADILDLNWSQSNFIITASLDKTVRLWHVSQKVCLCVFRHTDVVTSVKFHPVDDRYFLSGSMDARIRIWSIPNKKVAFWNEAPDERIITAVGFSMDGKTVCAGADTGDVFFFDTQALRYNTQVLIKNRRQKHGKKVTGIEPMPNLPPGEDRVLVTTNDSRVWMINMKDKSFIHKYKGLKNNMMQIRATFSDDGRYIISGSEEGRIYLWCTDQVTYFPFESMYDNHLQSAILSNTRDHTRHIMHDENHFEGQLQGLSGLIKRSERKVRDRVQGMNESFYAHDHTVTTTAFAPTKTKQQLAKTGGDIILDNTPVYAYKQVLDHNEDEEEIVHWLKRTTTHSKVKKNPRYVLEEALPRERESFIYPDSQIIVSADLHGSIKVWRMDSGVYEENIDENKSKSVSKKGVLFYLSNKLKKRREITL